MIGCPECGGRVAPGRWMCHECERRYLTLLRDVRPTMQALNSLAMKTARVGGRERGGGSGFAPSPIDWGMERLHTELAEWIRDTASHVRESWGSVPLRQWRLLWTRLVTNRTTLLQVPEAPEDHARLKRLMHAIDRTMHPGEDARLAGQCRACGTPLMATRDEHAITCPMCGETNDTDETHDRMLHALAGYYTTTTPQGAADWIRENTGVKISRNLIRMRVKRGTLAAHPEGDGYYRFPIAELLALAGEVEARAGDAGSPHNTTC